MTRATAFVAHLNRLQDALKRLERADLSELDRARLHKAQDMAEALDADVAAMRTAHRHELAEVDNARRAAVAESRRLRRLLERSEPGLDYGAALARRLEGA